MLPVSGICRAAPAGPIRDSVFVSFDGTRIFYRDLGQVRGRPVLLVHGFISTGVMWMQTPLLMQLLDAGYRVIVPDLRGNGRSDKPHALPAYENNAEIRDMTGLMAHLGLRRYDLIGYSRGAILAARQMTLDKHLRKVVLGGMGADFTDPNWPRRVAFAEALTQPGTHPELASALDYARSSGADTLALARMQQAQPATSPADLGRVRLPVLVIAGDADTDNGSPAALARLLPTATLNTAIPGTHNDTARSEGFAEAVLFWLAQ
jgi:pimeloyl-ACP methyl ester carboxylesterase